MPFTAPHAIAAWPRSGLPASLALFLDVCSSCPKISWGPAFTYSYFSNPAQNSIFPIIPPIIQDPHKLFPNIEAHYGRPPAPSYNQIDESHGNFLWIFFIGFPLPPHCFDRSSVYGERNDYFQIYMIVFFSQMKADDLSGMPPHPVPCPFSDSHTCALPWWILEVISPEGHPPTSYES